MMSVVMKVVTIPHNIVAHYRTTINEFADASDELKAINKVN